MIRDSLLQGSSTMVMGIHGSKEEKVQDSLADVEEVKGYLVDRVLEEVSCKMFSASSVRNLVIISHIGCLKVRILMRELVLLVIRIQMYDSLFMVYNGEVGDNSLIWLLDSGTSNHMTRKKELIYHLAEIMKHKVKLGDDKGVDVLGRGSMLIQVHGVR